LMPSVPKKTGGGVHPTSCLPQIDGSGGPPAILKQ
jgi:hypothetical protein